MRRRMASSLPPSSHWPAASPATYSAPATTNPEARRRVTGRQGKGPGTPRSSDTTHCRQSGRVRAGGEWAWRRRLVRTWCRDAVAHREARGQARRAGGRGELAHHPRAGVGRRAVEAGRGRPVRRRRGARGADRRRRTGRAARPRLPRSGGHHPGAALRPAARAHDLCPGHGRRDRRCIGLRVPDQGRHRGTARARRARGRGRRGAAAAGGPSRHGRRVQRRALHRGQPHDCSRASCASAAR